MRVLWEGSEYQGRDRETIWDGHAELSSNSFENIVAINKYNLALLSREQPNKRGLISTYLIQLVYDN
jgi:hypothetical protein